MPTDREYNSRQERILTYLEGKKNPTDASTLAGYLGITPTSSNMDNLRGEVKALIRDGLVKAYTIRRGGTKTEAYHLKGKGKSFKGKIQGHGKLERLLNRWFGSILLLFGLSFLVYQDLAITGNITSNQSFIASDLGFLFALTLEIFGGFFLIKSFK